MQNSLIENKIKTYLKQFKDMGSNTLEIDIVKNLREKNTFAKALSTGLELQGNRIKLSKVSSNLVIEMQNI